MRVEALVSHTHISSAYHQAMLILLVRDCLHVHVMQPHISIPMHTFQDASSQYSCITNNQAFIS